MWFKKLRLVLVQLLLWLLTIIQASYVSLFEGFILWLLQSFTSIGPDHSYLLLVLVCFAPNYAYTVTHAYKKIKEAYKEAEEEDTNVRSS